MAPLFRNILQYIEEGGCALNHIEKLKGKPQEPALPLPFTISALSAF
ncbi:hypothetical protein KIS4809_1466 [Bacillus sp. ZZV12-4809]|nr:hypothetical protein KIS4809_1466 [Bacillus sp. ZZV12-4809]